MDSKTVFELRNEAKDLSGIEKLNKLNNALNIARKLYIEDNSDEWIQKAFAWVLIDLCKAYIADKNLNQAGACFKELNTLDFQGYEDDIIEKQKTFLLPKIDINYSEIQKAEEHSKNGKHQEALTIFKNLISQKKLTEIHHEAYGWIIYRYIKAEESNLSSVEVRTFLRDYMNLKNERPSMLHSMVLNFALNYSKTHSDFKFYNFFLLWNPDNIRYDDLQDGNKDGKNIPSLISRICREFVNTNTEFDIEEFLDKINVDKEKVLDLFRETYFWNVFNAHKENSFSVLWNLFEQYNTKYSKYGQSKWHSEILNLAERFMKENDEWRFLNFFKKWNPENLRNEDWKEIQKDEKIYNSLAVKCYVKCFNLEFNNKINNAFELIDSIKSQSRRNDIIDLLKESFFWQLFNLHKENKYSELWTKFELYNVNFSKYEKSKWHSEVLNLAERFMKENDEWRFLVFFKNWNPENLRNEDWKEIQKDEHTYKPLATKAIKKAFEVLKTQTSEQNLSWLIQPYEKAIKLFPDDEWLSREKALLHFKNNELELAIKIYKQLVLELADKYYVWQEFSNCIVSDNSLKIGMLSKALSLEKNEDFLGDIHLDLAKLLIDENRLENAFVELEAYKKHREIKGWQLSSQFNELQQKAISDKISSKDNRELYKKYIPFAENFAYSDFDWVEVVLVDKWKDDKGKERLTFTDGKTIEFAIRKNRLEILKQSELGQILKFKLHKLEIKKEFEAKVAWFEKTVVTEYKYIPLIVSKTGKNLWEILDTTFAVVDYINKERNIIHAITTGNKEVFFPQIKNELRIGDFITAKSYTKKVKDENRTELRQIQKIDKSSVISKFQTQIAIVDGVNEQKQLFHFVISSELQGIVKYSETNLRPKEGDFIKLSFATKTDKDQKLRVKFLSIELTEKVNTKLRKEITGLLEVKYKNRKYNDDDFVENEELPNSELDENGKLTISNKPIPDFAFIEDYYVPKYLLEKHNITEDCRVNAKVIYAGDKWKLTEIEKL